MKKEVVVNIPSSHHVLSSRVCSSQFYGVEYEASPGIKRRGIVSRRGYFDGEFQVQSIHEFTKGNHASQSHWDYSTLSRLIRSMLDSGLIVYEFDTAQELFQWAAQST